MVVQPDSHNPPTTSAAADQPQGSDASLSTLDSEHVPLERLTAWRLVRYAPAITESVTGEDARPPQRSRHTGDDGSGRQRRETARCAVLAS